MSEDVLRTQLETQLGQLDWRFGVNKASLVERLATNPPAQKALTRSLVDGIYFSPADVLTSLPPGAWQDPPPPPTSPDSPGASNSVAGISGAVEQLTHIPPQVAAGALGGAALVGVAAGVGWLLRRRQHDAARLWRR
jgi:hypothetical protein